MIESQKQYEETLDFLKINRFAYDEANEIDDLIEALRKAIKAGIAYKDTLAEFGREPEGIYHVGDELLLDDWTEALAALSDWIKDDG